MASWFQANRKFVTGAGVLLTGWVAGTIIPNTLTLRYFDPVMKAVHLFYKDAKTDRPSRDIINEVFKEIAASRGYPVKASNMHFRLTTSLSPGLIMRKGCSTFSDAVVVLPIGMRVDARDAFYLHCNFDQKQKLERICLLDRDEQKFVYALTTLYSEDNYPLLCTALGCGVFVTFSGAYYKIASALSDHFNLWYKKELARHMKEDFLRFRQKQLTRNYRVLALAVLGIVGANAYWALRSYLSLHLEKQAHDKVANLGPAYAKAGDNYYVKVMYYNMFLRLLGIDVFTEQGEEIETISTMYPSQLPIAVKRQIYLDKQKQYESSGSDSIHLSEDLKIV